MTFILSVDDSQAIRQMVDATLSSSGYQVISAENGLHGLEAAGGQSFDLVISDVNMPEMGGYDFVRALRKIEEYAHVPVLMLTTEFEDRHKKAGRDAGANGWIIKPIDPDQLLRAVQRVVGRPD